MSNNTTHTATSTTHTEELQQALERFRKEFYIFTPEYDAEITIAYPNKSTASGSMKHIGELLEAFLKKEVATAHAVGRAEEQKRLFTLYAVGGDPWAIVKDLTAIDPSSGDTTHA